MKKIALFLLFLSILAVPAFAGIADPVSPVVSNDYVYVPRYINKTVTIYKNTNIGELVKTINLNGDPKGLALSPDKKTLYISTSTNAEINAYDAATGIKKTAFNVTAQLYGPRQIAVSPDGKLLYAVDAISQNVKIFDAVSGLPAPIGNINFSQGSYYGIAISPDNTMLAVTQRNYLGSVYVYSINRDQNGIITGYTLKATLTSNLVNPNIAVFSAESDRLYVRTHQNVAPFADLVVFSGSNNFDVSNTLSLLNKDEYDPQSPWGEAMAMSANGSLLYLTHYRSSHDSGETTTNDYKVHVYKVSTLYYDDANNVWGPRTNWALDSTGHPYTDGSGAAFTFTYDSKIVNNILPCIDGLASDPRDLRVWITGSESGVNLFSKYTGTYGNSSGNTIPDAPVLLNPSLSDDLANYTGNAKWIPSTAPLKNDGTTFSNYYWRYIVDYKKVSGNTWTNLINYSNLTETTLNVLIPGETYVLRVKALGSPNSDMKDGLLSPFVYSPQFKMAGPKINKVEVDTDRSSTGINYSETGIGYIYDSVKISGSGFGSRNLSDPTQPVDGANYNVTLSYLDNTIWREYIVPQEETTPTGKAQRIVQWDNNTIILIIPRELKQEKFSRLLTPRNDWNISVTAFNVKSNKIPNFKIGPIIFDMSPEKGMINDEVFITGLGFGASQGTSTVNFGSTTAAVTKWESGNANEQITCKVPAGLAVGTYPVKITVNGVDSLDEYISSTKTPGTKVNFEVSAQKPIAITKVSVKDAKIPGLSNYVERSEGYAYSNVKLDGQGFGSTPGKIELYDDQYRNFIAIPSANITWSDTAIEFWIPRNVGTDFIEAGGYHLVVKNSNDVPAETLFYISPKIYSDTKAIDPISGPVGKKIEIWGFSFGPTDAPVEVRFGTQGIVAAKVLERLSGIDHISVNVPALAVGEYPVMVIANNQESNNNNIFAVVAPVPPSITGTEVLDDELKLITYSTQEWGYVNSKVKLIGAGFGDEKPNSINNIKFTLGSNPNNISSANILSWKDNEIEFIIPRKIGPVFGPQEETKYVEAGEAPIRIQNEHGVGGIDFFINPKIFATPPIDPASGPVGKSVRIYGHSFGNIGEEVIVYFGTIAVSANVTDRGDNIDAVAVKVPTGLTQGKHPVKIEKKNYGSNSSDFTVIATPTPVISNIQVDINPDPQIEDYKDITDGVTVYQAIKIIGTGFGDDPADGNRDKTENNITIGSLTIRDDAGNEGLQVYSWSDTEIKAGIPRRIGQAYIPNGANQVVVTANNLPSPPKTINIKPNIYGSDKSSGYAGDAIKINGTALKAGSVYFGTALASVAKEDQFPGEDPDGTSNASKNIPGYDETSVTVPAGLTPGIYDVTVKQAALVSNILKFTVDDRVAPKVLSVIPNAAPNDLDNISVIIKGENFVNGATVTLKKTGQPDIKGTTAFNTAVQLASTLPIKNAVVGKWDVVVANPDGKSFTIPNGFTVLPAGGEISQVIDDYEGKAVVFPTGYTFFPDPANAILKQSNADKYEGDNSGAINYAFYDGGYRGYNGHLVNPLDLTNFKTVTVMVKGGANANGKVVLQVRDKNNKNFAAVTAAGDQKTEIPLSGNAWTKYTLQFSDFVEVVNGKPAGGAALDKSAILDYQLVFTGNDGTVNPAYIDFIAAGGYTPPVGPSDITTTLVRKGDTVGSALEISWVFNKGAASNADIYTISGKSEDAVFTTDITKWAKELSNVPSPQTIADQVGKGTQKYFKVVKTGDALTADLLKTDVAGKFDLIANEGSNLISLPVIPSSNSLDNVVGRQLNGGTPMTADKIYSYSAEKSEFVQAYLTAGPAGTWAGTLSFMEADKGFFIACQVGQGVRYVTVVGAVSSQNNRQISLYSGSNMVGTAWPVDVNLDNTALNSVLTNGTPMTADKVYNYENTAAPQWLSAYLGNAGFAGSLTKLMPGKGYYITNQVLVGAPNPDNWVYTKPY
ncbi:MAG: Glycoside hydrolase family 81 [Candidatus Saganbacteria bacterium]|uniref:Glycoside hydrolase family 81 n=1 Tax=Candidatus Saganbacteria bacterium TaxID=2575572 RepID=A0A833L1R2_UNCSA|nr:MAG: Glycoside hydrolase family 81 [Candidatus Saganbacteria bacterium]